MSMNDVHDLDEDAAGLLAAYRAEEAMPAPTRARVWQRIERDVRASAAPSAGLRPAMRAPPRARRTAIAVVALVAAAGLAWFGAQELQRDSSPRAQEALDSYAPTQAPNTAVEGHPPANAAVPTGETSAPAPAPAIAPSIPTAAPTSPTVRDVDPVPPSRRTPSPREAEGASIDQGDPLAAEAGLVREAQAALTRGGAEQALDLLSRCAREFPRGALLEERAALRVLALCAAGKAKLARREAAAFARRHGASPLAPRVAAACPEVP